MIERNELNGKFELDLTHLSRQKPKKLDKLIESPEETIEELKGSKKPIIKSVTLKNIPEFLKTTISKIRSDQLNKLIYISGILKKVTTVYPRRYIAKFECPSCGAIITIFQDTHKLKKPGRCSCGKRGYFRKVSEDLKDFQELEIEENLDEVGSKQPQRVRLILEDNLADPNFNKFQVGNKVDILGKLIQTPKYVLKDDTEKNILDYSIKVMQINPLESYEDDLSFSESEIEEIKKISKKNPLKTLADNLAPGISGLEKIKRAIILFMAKGVTKDDGVDRRRGETHLLIVGEAGLAKSALIQNTKSRLYNCRIADGKDATKAGIVATVNKDKTTGQWIFEAGDMVLANRGYLLIDESDKLNRADMEALHRPMEQGELNFAKASVKANLKTETSIFAVANPKTGMFEPDYPILKQINFPRTFLSRFDLVFILKDLPDEDKDLRTADRILNVHSGGSERKIDLNLFKKYFHYCSKLKPKLTAETNKKIKEIYTKLRKTSEKDGEWKGMPINTRHLEGLIRLSEAHAKIRLSETVDVCDVGVAEDLFLSGLSDFGFDPNLGWSDLSNKTTSVKKSKKKKYYTILELVRDYSRHRDWKFTKKEIMPLIQRATGMKYSEVEEIFGMLHQEGELFEPKTNTYKLLNTG